MTNINGITTSYGLDPVYGKIFRMVEELCRKYTDTAFEYCNNNYIVIGIKDYYDVGFIEDMEDADEIYSIPLYALFWYCSDDEEIGIQCHFGKSTIKGITDKPKIKYRDVIRD